VVRSVRQAGWIGRRTPTEVGPDEVTTLDMRPHSRVGAQVPGQAGTALSQPCHGFCHEVVMHRPKPAQAVPFWRIPLRSIGDRHMRRFAGRSLTQMNDYSGTTRKTG
jgi:hypothetical protein